MRETRLDESVTLAEDGFTPADEVTALAEDTTPTDDSMPRRAAMGIVGALAGLAALRASGASAHAGQAGLLVRVREVTEAVRVPNNSNRVLRMVCPRAPRGQKAYVLSGGYSLGGANSNNPAFVIKTNAPDTSASWLVDGHNVNTGSAISMGGFAICGYFRT